MGRRRHFQARVARCRGSLLGRIRLVARISVKYYRRRAAVGSTLGWGIRSGNPYSVHLYPALNGTDSEWDLGLTRLYPWLVFKCLAVER